MIKKVLVLLFLTTFFHPSIAQSVKSRWVDSVFHTLNVSEKVGHLFQVPVETNSDVNTIDKIQELIESHEIGGIILKQGSVLPPATLLHSFHKMSDVPLFIGYDGVIEQLMDTALVFPNTTILGAVNNNDLLFRYGRQLGHQLNLAGINLFFMRVNSTGGVSQRGLPAHDILSENPVRTASKSLALLNGLQQQGIVTCSKFFTTESVTVVDAKGGNPVLNIAVDSTQLRLFDNLIRQGVRGILTASTPSPVHYGDVNSRRVDYTDQMLTSYFTSGWLRDNMQFAGLTFVNTDQITGAEGEEGEAELLAFQAGNDILISKDVANGIRKIKRLVRKDAKYAEQLDHSVKKILAAKFDARLWQSGFLAADESPYRTAAETKILNQHLHEEAVTVIRNDLGIIPQRLVENKKYVYIATFATAENHLFYDYLSKYVFIDNQALLEDFNQRELIKSLSNYQTIIVGTFPQTAEKTMNRLNGVLEKLSHRPQIILCDFGSAGLGKMAREYDHVITGYVANKHTFKAVPEILFGALPAKGTTPYTFSPLIREGTGIQTESLERLSYSLPEDAAMDSRVLTRIDSIVKEAIVTRGTPGCQVLVARKGKVIYDKSFGHLTYDQKTPVTSQTLYDLASLTKVTATLQTAMFMHEHRLIDLHKKVSHYLPLLKKSNKKDITIIDMLTHQSGLVPFIPMYPETMKDTLFLPLYYSRVKSEKYPLHVADHLYASPVIRDSVWNWIMRSKLNERPARTPFAYKYSDLGFLILQRLAEKELNQPMDDFLMQNLYEPLGAYTLGFNPLSRFNKQTIAPTEDDKIYRRTSVAGTVHDERAAMLGGVAGHAGLFGTANDLSKLAQMLLQKGHYGGIQYYKPETVNLFTARTYRTSRRGIGWDKPVQGEWNSPTSIYASPATFGHTGFTGTCMWIDPEFDLVYIFLSNRVYPDRSAKLINENIRSRIQDVIYRSIFSYQERMEPVEFVNELATIKPGQTRPLE